MVLVETRYPNIEKLTLALLIASQKLKPYFQVLVIVVLINHPLKQVLHILETSGRLMRWSMELSEYKIRYLLRVAIKGQAIANFIVELTPNEEVEVLSNSYHTTKRPSKVVFIALKRTLYVDGSSNDHNCGVDLFLTSFESENLKIKYAPRLDLKLLTTRLSMKCFWRV